MRTHSFDGLGSLQTKASMRFLNAFAASLMHLQFLVQKNTLFKTPVWPDPRLQDQDFSTGSWF